MQKLSYAFSREAPPALSFGTAAHATSQSSVDTLRGPSLVIDRGEGERVCHPSLSLSLKAWPILLRWAPSLRWLWQTHDDSIAASG